MKPGDWSRIQEVYDSARSKPPAERKAFVEEACETDSSLACEVTSLLKSDDTLDDFLDQPIFELGLRIILNSGPAPDDLIGKKIDDRYLIVRNLSHGAMGSVYLAQDGKLHSRQVAIKVLLTPSLQNDLVVQKFRQEKEAMARVNHPGVVNILDAGELSDGKPYIVMQYVDGVSLREAIIAEPQGLQLRRAASLVKQIGTALSAVHEQRIYHRDLKPENIMLRRLAGGEEQVKVVDFGIAKVKESMVAPSTAGANTMGTFAYMSPEQLLGEKVTEASDVYAFAVIAYEMVTGRRPFSAGTAAKLAEMQRLGKLVKPAELQPRLSQEAQTLILNGLAVSPPSRPANAGEYADRLSRALLNEEQLGVTATADKASGSVAFLQRRRLLVVAGSIIIVALVVGTYWIISKSGWFTGPPARSTSSSSSPHRALSYSVTVQKMKDGISYLEESNGQELIQGGIRFRLNFSSRQAGYLYVLNEGASNFTLIYPTPETNNDSARLEQNQDGQSNWNTFLEPTGTDRFWIIWSKNLVSELEIARHEAFKNKQGVITDETEVRKVREFLSEHSAAEPQTTRDTAKQRTNVWVPGDQLVKLFVLEHR